MEAGPKAALLAANGVLPSSDILASLLALHPYVLAADGGANKLLERAIVPDAVIGDFDSLDAELPDGTARVAAPDQEFTDLDKALAFLVENHYEAVSIVGAVGDRLDHTFGAFSQLIKYGELLDVALVDDIGTARPVVDCLIFDAEPGQVVSLIPLGKVSSITTSGLRWNLSNESLEPGVRDGISNEAASAEVSISVGGGPLIAYIHHVKS